MKIKQFILTINKLLHNLTIYINKKILIVLILFYILIYINIVNIY